MSSNQTTDGYPFILIKYHNERMLATIDMNVAIKILLATYGTPLVVRLEAMTEYERRDTIEEVSGFEAVRERFQFFEVQPDGVRRRRMDLEKETVREGQK